MSLVSARTVHDFRIIYCFHSFPFTSSIYSTVFLGIKYVDGQWVTAHDNATLTYTYWTTLGVDPADGECVKVEYDVWKVASCDENFRIACSVDAYGMSWKHAVDYVTYSYLLYYSLFCIDVICDVKCCNVT